MENVIDHIKTIDTQLSGLIIQSNDRYNDFSHRMEIISNGQTSELQNAASESFATVLQSETFVVMVFRMLSTKLWTMTNFCVELEMQLLVIVKKTSAAHINFIYGSA